MAIPGGITFGAPLALGSQPYTPITFGAPLLRLTQPAEAALAAPAGLTATAEMPLMVPQYVGGAEGPGMDAMGGAMGGAMGLTPIEGMGVISTPFGPITQADIIGGFANLLAPIPAQLLSLATTGQSIGAQMKGALTPVSTAASISSQAFGLAEQLGVTPQEAQSLITTLGLEGMPATGAATGVPDASLTGGSSLGIDAFGPGGPGGDVGGIGGNTADSGAATGGGVM